VRRNAVIYFHREAAKVNRTIPIVQLTPRGRAAAG
jgi:hypothetical protein